MGEQTCCKHHSHKFGSFKRKSDSRTIQRFRCHICGKTWSNATHDLAVNQKKRTINYSCMTLLASGMSMRRIAINLKVQPNTVAKKLSFLAKQCAQGLQKQAEVADLVKEWQFDELQTFEHTKCKPLSVAMAVDKKTRKIMAFWVSEMPATGFLSKISRKKYGKRKDKRPKGLNLLFRKLKGRVTNNCHIMSDKCLFYNPTVTKHFPNAIHSQFKGKKGSEYGQGELKKVKFDPLFCINHTFAMLRDNISRLIRKTWRTTKKMACLIEHLMVYVWVHNNAWIYTRKNRKTVRLYVP
jgi:hypothetical protein